MEHSKDLSEILAEMLLKHSDTSTVIDVFFNTVMIAQEFDPLSVDYYLRNSVYCTQ